MRASPSSSAPALYGFPAGRPFRVIGREGGLAHIQDLRSSASGWIDEAALALPPRDPAASAPAPAASAPAQPKPFSVGRKPTNPSARSEANIRPRRTMRSVNSTGSQAPWFIWSRRCLRGNFPQRQLAQTDQCGANQGASRGARGVEHAQASFSGHRRRFSPCHLGDWMLAQTVPPDLPLAVICFNEKTQTWRVGYLQEVNKDGSATYVGRPEIFGLR